MICILHRSIVSTFFLLPVKLLVCALNRCPLQAQRQSTDLRIRLTLHPHTQPGVKYVTMIESFWDQVKGGLSASGALILAEPKRQGGGYPCQDYVVHCTFNVHHMKLKILGFSITCNVSIALCASGKKVPDLRGTIKLHCMQCLNPIAAIRIPTFINESWDYFSYIMQNMGKAKVKKASVAESPPS